MVSTYRRAVAWPDITGRGGDPAEFRKHPHSPQRQAI